MQSLRVVVDLERVGKTRAGPVFTGIAMRADGEAFPSESWTDFAVVVLSWWIPAMSRVYADGQREELRFMEGPYWAEVWRDADGWAADLVEDHAERVVRTIRFDPQELARSLIDAADATLRLCRDNHWWSSDAENLEASVSTFRHAAHRVR